MSTASHCFNAFNLTKVWPHAAYPPIAVGRFVLDRNLANYFAEIEAVESQDGSLPPADSTLVAIVALHDQPWTGPRTGV